MQRACCELQSGVLLLSVMPVGSWNGGEGISPTPEGWCSVSRDQPSVSGRVLGGTACWEPTPAGNRALASKPLFRLVALAVRNWLLFSSLCRHPAPAPG